tara:strand:+ start:874 stop:1122 length:249 start_codon:yes stop_codon:yes gene_type:complete
MDVYKELFMASEEDEAVMNPEHYSKEISPWEYMEQNFTEEGFRGYLVGNIYKYLDRFERKAGRLDLLKAKKHLDKLLEVYQC